MKLGGRLVLSGFQVLLNCFEIHGVLNYVEVMGGPRLLRIYGLQERNCVGVLF